MPDIVLDPGHGGRDAGAYAFGRREADLNLEVARRARAYLERLGLSVAMIRDADKEVPLVQRGPMVNEWRPKGFVSIHHNAAADPAARGVELYRQARGDHTRASRNLAVAIHENFRRRVPEIPDRGIKTRLSADGQRDYYHVLRVPKVPSVLIEGGFMTNRAESDLMHTDSYQDRAGRAIAEGIAAWLQVEAPAPPPEDFAPPPDGITIRPSDPGVPAVVLGEAVGTAAAAGLLLLALVSFVWRGVTGD